MQNKKNSDQMPENNPQNTPAISIYIESRNKISNKGWQNLLKLLNKWHISHIFVQGQLSNEHAIYQILRDRDDRSLDQIKLIYQFDFNFQTLLNANRDSISTALLSMIFSTNQYYYQTKSWGEKIRKIFGWKPEIIHINVNKKSIRRHLADPESIYAIIKIWNEQENTIYEAVTDSFNKETGWIRLSTDKISKFSLLIIRSAKLLDDGIIRYYMNYFNKKEVQAAQKYFIKSLLPKGIQEYGVYYDLDSIIPLDGQHHWIFSSQEIEKEIGDNLAIAYATMILNNYKVTLKYSKVIHKLREQFLTNTFPSLQSVSDTVHFKIDTEFPFPLDTLPQNVYYEVDEKRFVQPSPYYWETIKKLRLNNVLASNNAKQTSVLIHDLFNTSYSFADKKYHIDQLLLFGCNCISFRLGYPWFEELLQVSDSFKKNDPNLPGYGYWFQYIEQLSNLLNHGLELCDILVLNPPPESVNNVLHRTLQHLIKTGISHFILDIENFENNNLCSIKNDSLQINNRSFRILLLPGLDTLSLNVLKKIHCFIEKGGIVVSLVKLPQYSVDPKNQDNFNQLRDKMWLEESSSSVTLVRSEKSGGVGYYIPAIEEFDASIPEISDNLNIRIDSTFGNVIYTVHEKDDVYYLFILNLNSENISEIEIVSSLRGNVYVWDFNQQDTRDYPFWRPTEDGKHISIRTSLYARESQMFVIQKADYITGLYLENCMLDELDFIRLNKGKVSLRGWQRVEGDHYLTVGQKDEIIKVEYQIKHKLPILELSTKNWFLESPSYTGNVSLGDRSPFNGHESEPLIYHKLIMIAGKYTNDQRLILDLGSLFHWCQVYINDTYAGQALYPPWRFDVTDFIKAGENKISIKVISNLSNLLAGLLNRNRMDYPVLESGLFGPVSIIPYTIVEIGL